MEKFYMIKSDNSYLKGGSLVKCDNNKLTVIDPDKVDVPNDGVESDDWIELSKTKIEFLRKKPLTMRIEIHNSGLFEKIEKLKINDGCLLLGSTTKYQIIQRSRNELVVRAENGTEKHVSILEIESVLEQPYYICITEVEEIEVGTIITEGYDGKETYRYKVPDNNRVQISIDKLKLISEEEAQFLLKSPPDERLKMHKNKLLNQIKKLKEGDLCFLRFKEDSCYKIKMKIIKDGRIKFVLQSTNKKIVRVDYSEIRLWTASEDESLRLNFDDATEEFYLDNKSDTSRATVESGNEKMKSEKLQEETEVSYYQLLSIPISERKFEEIDMNSLVIYYFLKHGVLLPLYGIVRWIGIDSSGEYFYGLELDNEFESATNGVFNKHRLFECETGYGILASIERVAPDTRFSIKDSHTPPSDISSIAHFCIPSQCWKGENCGIQGDKNSCLLITTIFALFAKFDFLDFMISPTYKRHKQDSITHDLRSVIAWKIVYPLREFGFVSYHHIDEMINVLKGFGGRFVKGKNLDFDSDDVSILFSRLCPNEPLISLRSMSGRMNSVMFLQLLINLEKKRSIISSQKLLETFMAQNEIMFEKPPACLIIQAHRPAKGLSSFDNILPQNIIDISNLCLNFRKKCYRCKMVAAYQCKKCIEDSLRTKAGLWCKEHKCCHKEIHMLPSIDYIFESEVKMHLRAIICLEDGYYVSYVKDNDFNNNWSLFDGICTRDIDGACVPKVSTVEEVSHFLNSSINDMRKNRESKSGNIMKVLKNSHMFVYCNTSLTCY